MINFDHNATTPLDASVLERMLPFLRDEHGNASSVHSSGQRARHAVDDAREAIAAALGCTPKEIIFTSGGTEANNLAIRQFRNVVTTQVEHVSVLDAARSLNAVEVAVNSDGRLDLDALASAITSQTELVSVMWANNETGVIFPIARVAELCRERKVPLHVDAVQAAGKIPIDLRSLPTDYLSISAHKLYGPKGIGALFVRNRAPFKAAQLGGHQERGRRGGTENVAAIVGFGAAIQLRSDMDRIRTLRDDLQARLSAIPSSHIVGGNSERVANTLCICFRDVEAEAILMALDLAGICASSGSACSAGSLEPSHVIRAMGFGPEWLRGAIRLSLGRENTTEEVAIVANSLTNAVARLRAIK